MFFSSNLLEKVKDNYDGKKYSSFQLNIINLGNNVHICKDNWTICTVDELEKLITELVNMKHAIEEETGIILN